MTATQLRHAKLWFAGRESNWDLATYEIDELKEGLEEARSLHPTFDGIPVAEMMKTIIDPRIVELEKAVSAKSNDRFTVAFDELTSGCNACHAAASKPSFRVVMGTSGVGAKRPLTRSSVQTKQNYIVFFKT